MNGLAKVFGRNLQSLRKMRGFTQQELGNRAKVDYKHLGSVERGEKSATLETVEKIASALSVEPYELLLPDRLAGRLLEQGSAALMHDLVQFPRSDIERFCRDVITSVQKLDSKKTIESSPKNKIR